MEKLTAAEAIIKATGCSLSEVLKAFPTMNHSDALMQFGRECARSTGDILAVDAPPYRGAPAAKPEGER